MLKLISDQTKLAKQLRKIEEMEKKLTKVYGCECLSEDELECPEPSCPEYEEVYEIMGFLAKVELEHYTVWTIVYCMVHTRPRLDAF